MSSEFPTVFILSGGLGTRLGAVAKDIPKAMVPVAGKPFVAHQLGLLRREGVTHCVMCLSHLQEKIVEFVGDGSAFGLSVDYSFDGERRLGTGGAVKQALLKAGQHLAVLYGDTYLDIQFAPVYDNFRSTQKSGLMTVLANDNRWDKSNVLFRDDRIVCYDKRNALPEMQHIDYGLSVFDRNAFDIFPNRDEFDLADLFQALIAAGDLSGYEVHQRFYEIGTPQGLAETEDYLQQKTSTKS